MVANYSVDILQPPSCITNNLSTRLFDRRRLRRSKDGEDKGGLRNERGAFNKNMPCVNKKSHPTFLISIPP